MLRLKAVIEAKLHDPYFKPMLAAAAAGISVRYANALLAQEGTSLERFIMRRRFLHCRQALEDPAQMHRAGQRYRLCVGVFRHVALHAAIQGRVRLLAERMPRARMSRLRCEKVGSVRIAPGADEPHEGLDLGAVMVLVGAHDQSVLHVASLAGNARSRPRRSPGAGT